MKRSKHPTFDAVVELLAKRAEEHAVVHAEQEDAKRQEIEARLTLWECLKRRILLEHFDALASLTPPYLQYEGIEQPPRARKAVRIGRLYFFQSGDLWTSTGRSDFLVRMLDSEIVQELPSIAAAIGRELDAQIEGRTEATKEITRAARLTRAVADLLEAT